MSIDQPSVNGENPRRIGPYTLVAKIGEGGMGGSGIANYALYVSTNAVDYRARLQ